MNTDRKNLIETCWKGWNLRCPCGRCDCMRTDPFRTARRIFEHWAREYLRFAETYEKQAEGLFKIANDYDRKRQAHARKYGGSVEPDTTDTRGMAERRVAWARQKRHAASLYQRLAAGQKPFAATTAAPVTKTLQQGEER